MKEPIFGVPRWKIVMVGLGLWFCVAIFATGYFLHQPKQAKQKLVAVERPKISPHASLAEVNANIEGKPYQQGALQELPGYMCAAWGHKAGGHAWIVIECTK